MNEVMSLFEGVCPNCIGAEVEIICVSGTTKFFDEYGIFDCENVSVWENSENMYPTDGEVEFKCVDGCSSIVVAHNIYGDWNL